MNGVNAYAKIREELEDLEDNIDPADTRAQELAFQGYEMAYLAHFLEQTPQKRAVAYLAARIACGMLRKHLEERG